MVLEEAKRVHRRPEIAYLKQYFFHLSLGKTNKDYILYQEDFVKICELGREIAKLTTNDELAANVAASASATSESGRQLDHGA